MNRSQSEFTYSDSENNQQVNATPTGMFPYIVMAISAIMMISFAVVLFMYWNPSSWIKGDNTTIAEADQTQFITAFKAAMFLGIASSAISGWFAWTCAGQALVPAQQNDDRTN